MKFRVENQIFEQWPEVRLGVVVGLGVKNTDGEAILELLREQGQEVERELQGQPIGQLPTVAPWRQAYKAFGVKKNKYVSSVEALLKRASKGNTLPDINPLVNAYNYLSLKYQMPFGGEDLDAVVGDVRLVRATGDESGVYIGSDEPDTCKPGEVAYVDDKGFICRRWNWREAARTMLTPETENVILVAEAPPPVSDEQLNAAVEELKSLISEYLGGKVLSQVVTKDAPEWGIDFISGNKVKEGK